MKTRRILRRNSLLYLLCFLCIFISFIVIFLSFKNDIMENPIIETKNYDVLFLVRNGGIGFDLNNTALTFGAVNPGGSATRSIEINNNRAFPVEVRFSLSKEIEEYIKIEKESYYLGVNETLNIPIVLSVPVKIKEGSYKGKIVILISRA